MIYASLKFPMICFIYEFLANKAQLGAILGENAVDVKLIHHDGQREVGQV